MPNVYPTMPGDTWEKISARTGEPVEDLKAAYPGIAENGEAFPPGFEVFLPHSEGNEDEARVAEANEAAVVPAPPITQDPAVPPAPADPISPEALLALYNTGSELADRLHSFLTNLQPVVS
jgi:phage tail protein X